MPEQLPAPLVPAEVVFDKDEDVIPLSFESLRYGELCDLHDARVFRAVVYCMAWAWRGKPAASISVSPDRWFRLCFETQQWWALHRKEVISRFVLCSDGKRYHPGLAALALERARLPTLREAKRVLDVGASEWVRLRAAVFARDGYRCVYCGMSGVPLAADHLLALANGGKSSMENLVSACVPCNSSKGAKRVEDWLP
jgi:hypothetical protein